MATGTMTENIQIVSLNESLREQWDEYVFKSSASFAYHLSGWKTVVETTFGHRTFYLALRENGSIKGILPLVLQKSKLFGTFFTSLPFCSYAGICAEGESEAELLLEAAIKVAQKEKAEHIEFHHTQEDIVSLPCKKNKVSMLLSLDRNPEVIWKKFDAKARNQVRKAEKFNLIATNGGEELLDDFYRIFAINMRDLGTPVYSKDFFKNILKVFPHMVRIFCVRLNRKPIAASFTIGFKDTMEVPWASSLRAYRPLCTNNLLYWKMIEFACLNGFAFFDFGRSSRDSGTLKFKEQWGAKPRQLYWHYWLPQEKPLPEINSANPKYKLFIGAWKKLPVCIANQIGPHIAKNVP